MPHAKRWSLAASPLVDDSVPVPPAGGRIPTTYHRTKTGRALANELRVVDATLRYARDHRLPTAFLEGAQAALRWALLNGPVKPSKLAVERP